MSETTTKGKGRRRALLGLALVVVLPTVGWGLYARVPAFRQVVDQLLIGRREAKAPRAVATRPIPPLQEGAPVPDPAPVTAAPASAPVASEQAPIPPVGQASAPNATPRAAPVSTPTRTSEPSQAPAPAPPTASVAEAPPALPAAPEQRVELLSAPVSAAEAPALTPVDAAPATAAPIDEAPANANEVRLRSIRPPLPSRYALTIRSGSFTPRAGGEFFATVNSALTLSPGALRAQSIGVDGSWLLTDRWELVVAIEGSTASAQTEARSPRPGGGAPVVQSNLFAVEPVGTIATRFYLVPPYRWDAAAGWVAEPSRVFLGGGIGMLSYLLNQQGEFLDELKLRTFQADLESRGVGRAAFLAAGIDVALVAKLALLLEARYQWANAPLAGSYRSFDRIDLSGLRLSVGAQRRW